MTDLEHELAEAKLEIARHHRDFELIRSALDRLASQLEGKQTLLEAVVKASTAIGSIRNIVG